MGGILFNGIKHYLFSCSNCPWFGHEGPLQAGFYVLLTSFHHSFCTSLLSSPTKYSRVIISFPCHTHYVLSLSLFPGSLHGEDVHTHRVYLIRHNRNQISGCMGWWVWVAERNDKGVQGNFWGVKTYQNVHFKYMQLTTCK